jgi:hypothetical protein
MFQSSEDKEFTSLENCELFECGVYMEDVCDVICIVKAGEKIGSSEYQIQTLPKHTA